MIRKIADILKEKEKTYSFEFFPPKTEKGRAKLTETASVFAMLEPDWFSVTYGAGGSTRQKTMRTYSSPLAGTTIDALATDCWITTDTAPFLRTGNGW